MKAATRLRHAGSAAFSPASIAGLKYWGRASDLALSNGAAVSSWTDQSGFGNHAAQATGANQPKFYNRQTLYLSGANGAFAYTPDSAAVSITGNLTVIALGLLPDTNWAAPSVDYTIAGKWNDTTISRGWKMKIPASLTNVEMAWTNDGTNQFQAISRSYAGVTTSGQRMDFAVEVEPNNAGAWACRWYYRVTGSGNPWTQLGATASGTGSPGGIFDDTARLVIGSRDTGNTTGGAFFVGEIAGLQVYSGLAISGVGAVLKASPDFTTATYSSTTSQTADFADGQANTWTVVNGARMPMIRNGLATVSFIPLNYLATPSMGTLSQPFTLFVAGRAVANGSAGQTDPLITDGLASTNKVRFRKSYTASAWSLDGGTAITGGTLDAAPHVFAMQLNGASSLGRIDGTQVITGNAGSQTITGLTIGAANAGSNGLVGDISEICLYNAALTTPQIQQVEAYMKARYGTP